MSDNAPKPNGPEPPAEPKKETWIHIRLDHETMLVGLEIVDVNLGLAQMMLHEATIQLDTMRRQAAAMQLRNTIEEQRRVKALADQIGRRGGRA